MEFCFGTEKFAETLYTELITNNSLFVSMFKQIDIEYINSWGELLALPWHHDVYLYVQEQAYKCLPSYIDKNIHIRIEKSIKENKILKFKDHVKLQQRL